MSELKPCPFCGGDLLVVNDRGDGGCEPLLYRPQCQKCGVGLGGFNTRAEAIATWNRRAQTFPAGGWREIASAPRDGTWFLACATKPGWRATRIVYFADPYDRLPIHGEGNMWPSPPTHWMPLPAPPHPEGKGEGE